MTLILGASGQLGRALCALLPDADTLGRDDLDLTDTQAIRPALAARAPGVIVNCAAYTNVDGAETDEDTAIAVNCAAVGEIAAYAARRAIPFVTYSTDYVFDGTASRPYVESDRRNPLNAYGRSKACGERLASSAYPDTLVIRTAWLISGMGDDFVTKVLRRASASPTKVVNDQRGCPTVVDDLAAATVGALEAGAGGLLHITNTGTATWFELAVAAAELAGIDPGRLIPCTSEEFPTQATRPATSLLGSERREELGVGPIPHWRDSLPVVVKRFRESTG